MPSDFSCDLNFNITNSMQQMKTRKMKLSLPVHNSVLTTIKIIYNNHNTFNVHSKGIA